MGSIFHRGVQYSGTNSSAQWGTISGTLANQADLQNSLNTKYDPNDTTETAIADGDYFPYYDISATAKRKSLWSNIKSTLKTYFDDIYLKITQKDTFSAESTQSNGQVSFSLWFPYETDPNATDYGFDLWYSQPLGSYPVSPTVPKWKSVTVGKSELTTGVTISLTYVISGGTNGSSKFRVRILK